MASALRNEKLDKFYIIKGTFELLKISESTFQRWKRDGTLRVVVRVSTMSVDLIFFYVLEPCVYFLNAFNLLRDRESGTYQE